MFSRKAVSANTFDPRVLGGPTFLQIVVADFSKKTGLAYDFT
ncbi:hypothetical protein M595_0834 [Lyngbya aestuarii BL J]|uniref:Uncharacterized protein n=1 Tax=Lyngbya aestuarii BL J TaxID=1348334 RepID=U7QS15_9CYAN|nr:hypothetical protein [Lyngbya aestuarii]ERT09206.1 hypothetical protein M595_0834 [Lyngbya aestuarii BL J]